MAIYDCFQYFNEDQMVDLRMNILNDSVDYFVISESTKTHQGNDKKLNFNIENFKKYKHKIIYKVAEFKEEKNFLNHKGGESIIEQHQRNNIINGLNEAHDNDLIILSDSDEIPDLKKVNQIKPKTKFTAFSQKMFMYKLNLQNLNENNQNDGINANSNYSGGDMEGVMQGGAEGRVEDEDKGEDNDRDDGKDHDNDKDRNQSLRKMPR